MQHASGALKHLSRITLLLAFMVVILGAYTRLVHAGLGCPDWPGCYGFLIAPETQADISLAEQRFPESPVDLEKVWPEVIHRLLAGSLGLLILTLFSLSLINTLKQRKQTQQSSSFQSKLLGIMLITVIFQAILGMWTVTLKLWPQVVTAHLIGGFTTLSLAWLFVLNTHAGLIQTFATSIQHLRSLKRWGLLVAGAVIVQIILGGWTSTNYAALACTDFPTCQSRWIPEMDFATGFNIQQTIGPNYLGGRLDNDSRVAIHFSHRVGALFVTLMCIFYAVKLWLSKQHSLRLLAFALLTTLALQVTLGISNIIFSLPLFVAVAHNAVGVTLLLVVLTINYQLMRATAKHDVSENTETVSEKQLA